jgi:tagatose 1,6-diphosphate aldolase
VAIVAIDNNETISKTAKIISKGKFKGLQACANERGVIAATAMDQRGSLRQSLEKILGPDAEVGDEALAVFKEKVTKVLSQYSSAILLDPEYGLSAVLQRKPGTGVILAYEETGYDPTTKGRLPDLLPGWSVQRLIEAGADAIKVLLYYNPFDERSINDIKKAFIERVGAECQALDIPFFLEPLAYADDAAWLAGGLDYARRKPLYITRMMEEFSQSRYAVDVLKVELPIDMAYMKGSSLFKGDTVAYDRKQAKELLNMAAAATSKPFIYLSAGVSNAVFIESLELAIEAGVPFSGVLCGRATWKDGIAIFAKEGAMALEEWLMETGVKNVQALNQVLAKGAVPWLTR